MPAYVVHFEHGADVSVHSDPTFVIKTAAGSSTGHHGPGHHKHEARI